METVTIPRDEYNRMKAALRKLRELEKLDFDLIRQFKESLEDVKSGKVHRIA